MISVNFGYSYLSYNYENEKNVKGKPCYLFLFFDFCDTDVERRQFNEWLRATSDTASTNRL